MYDIVSYSLGRGQSSANDSEHQVNILLPNTAARDWMAVPMPGYGETGTDLSSVVGGRVRMPQDFARQLYPLLAPGTTLLVTDAPVLEENSGTQMTVMGSGNPNAPAG